MSSQVDTGTTNVAGVGARAAAVKNLKVLKTPEEGGTKKDYEDFLEKIHNHVMVQWNFGPDIGHVIKKQDDPEIEEPTDLTATEEGSKLKVRLWNAKVDYYAARTLALEENKKALYALMFDALSKIMKSRLRGKAGYHAAEGKSEVKWLLNALDEIMVRFEEIKPKILSLDDQMERIMKLKQGAETTNEDFLKTVAKEIKVYEKHGGHFLWGPAQEDQLAERIAIEKEKYKRINAKEMDAATENETEAVEKRKLKERIVTMAVLKRTDKKRFGNLQIGLKNKYLLGQDEYPKTTGDLLKVLNHYKPEWSQAAAAAGTNATTTTSRPSTPTPGTSFLQAGGGTVNFLRGTNNSFYPEIVCRLCRFPGHYQTHCPVATDTRGTRLRNRQRGNRAGTETSDASSNANAETDATENAATEEEVSSTCHGVVFNQQSERPYLNPNWVLLDSESTDHIFCSDRLVTDIKTVTDGEFLRLHSTGGHLDTHQKGRFGGFTVWYNPSSLANILSLALVTDQYRVTMDSHLENALVVHISAGHTIKFFRYSPGLYYFDTSNIDIPKLRNAFNFLNTVDNNKKYFGKRELRKADLAVLLNRRINHVAKGKAIRIMKMSLIRNNPLTVGDVRRSHTIYGPPLPPIHGRTRYQESPRVRETDIIQLPKELFDDLKNVTLGVDFHYVNGVAVFHSITRRIGYRTVSFPLSRSATSIIDEMRKIFKVYNARGFRITEVHADKEFEKVQNDVLPANMRICGVDDHVPEIERSVQTQKNENRSVCQAMPYRCIPRIMIRELVKQGNVFLNAFGTRDNVADGLTPRNIIDNLPHIDYNDLKYEFGEYVQIHITEKVTNTMKSRTIGAIVLGPRNIQGQYNFMSLETGEQRDGRVVARLPITQEVINRVEELGLNQGQPFRASKMLKYEWRPGRPITDEDAILDHEDERPEILPAPIQQVIPPAGPNPFNLHNAANQGANENDENGDQQRNAQEEDQGAAQGENQGAAQGATQNEAQGADQDEDGSDEEQSDEEEDSDDDEEVNQRREEEQRRRGEHFQTFEGEEYGRGKRERRTRSFSFFQTKFENLKEEEKDEFFHHAWNEYRATWKTNMLERYACGSVFAQLSAKKGIERYGREAELKLLAEFKQLMEYKTFHGRNAKELTYEQKRKAANMINLIEEKVNRGHTRENPVIKGRSVFNGRVQRGLYTKEETASPTVSQDAFFLTSIIDAIEGRDKAITDIKGAYLNAKMKDEVLMKITGKEVDLFCEIDPSLREFVVSENGKDVLYVQLDRALYGCVQSALLWYELYSTTLMEMGFKLNPYDLCVANAPINGKQCTICWYVDDNKVSHVDKKVVDSVIKKIESKFGKMSQTRGDKHEFLGMDIVYHDKKVTVSMKKHIEKAIDSFEEDITREAATPATNYLFKVRDVPKIDEKRAENFHSVTAQLLFVGNRCRLDIKTAVAFLCTRVSEPDEDDWKKLKRVLQYLKGTLDLKLTLGADDIKKMKSWVDVSYGIHADCRSHTGGLMSWGWGVLLSKSQKQKLNTKSSTEGEIVGVSDYLPNVIWARMFLKEQGFIVDENILYQDNQSAIKIEENGKRSSGQKTKHMDNRYFWIKDRLNSENIKIRYCPTEKMIADFFTKPLQGNLFRLFRDIILGYKHISELDGIVEKLSDEERVRKDIPQQAVITDIASENNASPKKIVTGMKKTVTWADVVRKNNDN